jgi:hypothetical protein
MQNIQLVQAESDFYDVKTGMITRKDYYKNKKPLWEKPKTV